MRLAKSRHATLLVIVACGALGFLAIQLAPAPAGVVRRPNPVEAKPREPQDDPAGLPESVMGNPFSHPKLAPEREEPPPLVDEARELPPLTPLMGSISAVIGAGGLPAAGLKAGVHRALKPEENAGARRKESGAPPPRHVLKAVIGAEEPVALFSTNGADSRELRAGDRIAPGLRILRIDASGAVVSTGARTVRVPVGGGL